MPDYDFFPRYSQREWERSMKVTKDLIEKSLIGVKVFKLSQQFKIHHYGEPGNSLIYGVCHRDITQDMAALGWDGIYSYHHQRAAEYSLYVFPSQNLAIAIFHDDGCSAMLACNQGIRFKLLIEAIIWGADFSPNSCPD